MAVIPHKVNTLDIGGRINIGTTFYKYREYAFSINATVMIVTNVPSKNLFQS